MRWFINYIRSCFCEHDWELLRKADVYNDYDYQIGTKWTYRCKKCGYMKTYKDY